MAQRDAERSRRGGRDRRSQAGRMYPNVLDCPFHALRWIWKLNCCIVLYNFLFGPLAGQLRASGPHRCNMLQRLLRTLLIRYFCLGLVRAVVGQ